MKNRSTSISSPTASKALFLDSRFTDADGQGKWENDTPVFERNFILFLDEIEVHLHPAWQRKILPAVQKLFPNAQIFISTHSPL
ncbi:MAG: ATP-binding protein [Lewinellaceae bacterium]|nr:ATP-binding protein [Lewinellaceae bacterium]